MSNFFGGGQTITESLLDSICHFFAGEFLVARCICEDGWKPSHFTDAVLVFPGYQEEQFLLIFLAERVFSIAVKQEFERGRSFFGRICCCGIFPEDFGSYVSARS